MSENLKQLKLCKLFLHGYWNIADFDDLPTNGKHCRKCKDNIGILNIFSFFGTMALIFTIFGTTEKSLIAGFVVALIIHGSIHEYIMKYVRAIHGDKPKVLGASQTTEGTVQP